MKYLSENDIKESTMRVSLAFDDDGEVTLCGVDSDGCEWSIARLTNDGKLMLYRAIPESSGLKVDNHGRIKIARD